MFYEAGLTAKKRRLASFKTTQLQNGSRLPSNSSL